MALFDRALGETAVHCLTGIGKPEADSWVFPEVTTGDPEQVGLRIEILAVVVDDDVADYLESIDSGSEEAWFSSALPGPIADREEVERNSMSVPCPRLSLLYQLAGIADDSS